MRLDPKYFNLFMAVCAIITLFVILYGTISYTQSQQEDFQSNLNETNFSELKLKYQFSQDSLSLSSFTDKPVLIQFWSTWSGKSHAVNRQLAEYSAGNSDLNVIAASVKDDQGYIEQHVKESTYNFVYVEGTDLFQELKVPGVPSQILISANGELFDAHVGDDTDSLFNSLNQLMRAGDE